MNRSRVVEGNGKFSSAGDTAPYELFRMVVTGGQEDSAGLKLPDMRDTAISPDAMGAMNQRESW